jgi:hypothetical protein
MSDLRCIRISHEFSNDLSGRVGGRDLLLATLATAQLKFCASSRVPPACKYLQGPTEVELLVMPAGAIFAPELVRRGQENRQWQAWDVDAGSNEAQPAGSSFKVKLVSVTYAFIA